MILEVSNGAFSYPGGKTVINGINLSVDKGEALSVLGPNGVGKTTLLKCCLGLLNFNEGDAKLYGNDIKNLKPKDFWSMVSYIPQSHNFAFSYSGIDLVVLGRSSHLNTFEQPGKKDYERAYEILKENGILYLADKDCNKMSGGELQMILIAKALINEPKLIVLDEPETGLDFHNQILVLDLINKLVHEDGLSAIINTHYPTNALMISDKTILMKKEGSYIYGKTNEILNKTNIEDAFDVEIIINEGDYKGEKKKSIIPVAIRR